ncbi:MAG: hypothetical protein A2937_03575 [Candidatus Yonathbacteria bacterium RIFCSPLOWO2_01_FULL_47_33b]|uniref:DUF2188 domain-containing protein n=1 Tax=Candidatus Yonathbacteria bacterium RIFCSPLOWO2_01_FULL_47_33b TaxID=1802727 RepID=A0A1G2SG96_9BACT|nr:MAG: hypothetical protein A2937_03575 [Candidatus Yonathbacteria bacterium RIFCSPLOWO2_01_FULL_47_33b]
MDNYHITKDGDKWKFTKEGNERPSKAADTKQEIVEKMKDFMSDKTGSVKIHKEDGKIQEERTYQRKNDPRKSKG